VYVVRVCVYVVRVCVYVVRVCPPNPINNVYYRFQKSILLIVQYKYLKSCSEDFILKN